MKVNTTRSYHTSFWILILFLWFLQSCNKGQTSQPLGAHKIVFPEMTDTRSKTIDLQDKKIYSSHFHDVYFSNEYDGARLNDVLLLNDSTFIAVIKPENEPINESSYYSFKVWSEQDENITIYLNYGEYHHRYIPKISHDGLHWAPISPKDYHVTEDTAIARIKLAISKKAIWVSAQELVTSKMIYKWCIENDTNDLVESSIIGKSTLGRDIYFLNIGKGDEMGKKVVVLTSRQHPPEVTGHFAFEAFIKELLSSNPQNDLFFKKYSVWVYPLLNPDGVDLGHWRHSASGIDLNRDWANYNQLEIKTIVDHIAKRADQYQSNVVLGLDFHSTQEDVYYTLMDTMKHKLQNFHHEWIEAIDKSLPEYNSVTEPYHLNTAISKGWFYQYFNAESITFEIGDETDRSFIELKGKAAAIEMVKILIREEE